MPRKTRIYTNEFPHHITTRCNNREFNLKKPEVYQIFKKIFAQLQKKYVFKIHHFLLMSNHYHLIITTSETCPINKIIQLINSLTARVINRFLGRCGHLWGERYKQKVLNSISYIIKAIRYLYQNPIRAKLVNKITEWKNSTIHFWINKENSIFKIDKDPYLEGHFNNNAPNWEVDLITILEEPFSKEDFYNLK